MNSARKTKKDKHSSSVFRPRAERLAAGKALRDDVSRQSHAAWKPKRNRRDPVDVLQASNKGRLRELIPIRYGRMLPSPFTFLRGSAALMAYDLADTPTTRINVQACGDCHLLNFGLYASPERRLVFDVNDFDETLPAPWEWDLKRLVVSFVIAARDNKLSNAKAKDAAMQCARAYRDHLYECSKMSPLEVWYQSIDMETLIAIAPDVEGKRARQHLAQQARQHASEHHFPKIAADDDGHYRLVDQPPILFHIKDPDWEIRIHEAVADYRESLSDERRLLLDRYRLEDSALKVVGIGSVGTRCVIALFFTENQQPLILQFKEARRSVLEPYTAKCQYDNQGERVVIGQRLMQSSSDVFLGWVRGRRGVDFYVRQLRDMKMSVPIEGATATELGRYAEACGWTLARAHAKSGDAATICGYLGKSDAFDRAMVSFAVRYADQTERDHAALLKAVRSGRIDVLSEKH